MEIRFAKWGNSVAIRVPARVCAALGIRPGKRAQLDVRRQKLIITPEKDSYNLEELLDGITRENVHSEIPTGPSVGAEGAG